MSVTIEFFGVPRQRAGTERVEIEAGSLGQALAVLSKRFEGMAESCFDGNRLRPGYVANLNGDRFVSEPDTPLADGDSLLILSADAGG
ncbi:MAG: MoaD/ThiS family protein [Planctomycetes bacterium]|nr:MoaD/ThiS family protein [Planctomycetota bacterium]